ncbi:MAG: molybdenum cofactor guanylyltransferase [Pseudomonadales bacterium]|nr:molybdenum cofactor guanylyltransferase [Pseudomonadales bacterium]MCP5173241.1 molybdenum cofactor guanylyltransferase [Pseudomonadales bacterium]
MNECLGVVLAGGLSSRMGEDKAHLQRIDQQSMLDYTADQLKRLGLPTVYSGQVEHGGVADVIAEAGPVGGIYSILQRHQSDELLIVPVDMPLLDSQALRYLLETGRRQHCAVFYENSYLPLYLPVSAALMAHLNALFETLDPAAGKKVFSIRNLLSKVPYLEVPVAQTEQLFNTNTPKEWQEAMEQLERQGKTAGVNQ